MKATQERLLTRQETAEMLGIKPQTLAEWAMTAKHLPFVKIGRAVRYKRSDVERFIERSTIPANA